MGLCRRLKIKHLGALLILLSVFLYGVIQTLYLLSPAIERLSHRIYPLDDPQGHRQGHRQGQAKDQWDEHEQRHFKVLEQIRGQPHNGGHAQGHIKSQGHSQGEGRDNHESKGNDGHILRYRVIVNPSPGVQHGNRRARNRDVDSSSSFPKEGNNKPPRLPPSNSRNNKNSNKNSNRTSKKRITEPERDYCPQVRRPAGKAGLGDSQSWRTLVPGSVHVFSAFYESRLWQPAVRVVGVMAQGTHRANLSFCQVWTEGATYPEVVPLEASIVPEGHMDKKFAVYLLTCKLRSDRRPAAVSLVRSRCQSPAALLPVLNTDSSRERRVHFTVCLTPLHYNYNDTRRLVEMVELNRMFGAQRFVFYNYSLGADVERYIRSYVKEGLAEVIPWRLPVGVDQWPPTQTKPEIHYFGQLAALNDCLYRNMYKSRYLVFSDLDEILVPKVHNTWKELLGKLQKEYKQRRFSKFGAFVFQCVFFRTDWPDDVNVTSLPAARKFNLLSLLKTKRERDVFPWGMRSKYIIDPLKVAMVGVHNVWQFIANRYMENNVPAELGLLHHYRYWAEPAQSPQVIDDSLHKYTDVILSRVRERHDIVPPSVRKGRR